MRVRASQSFLIGCVGNGETKLLRKDELVRCYRPADHAGGALMGDLPSRGSTKSPATNALLREYACIYQALTIIIKYSHHHGKNSIGAFGATQAGTHSIQLELIGRVTSGNGEQPCL
jgi:hypothetical protein